VSPTVSKCYKRFPFVTNCYNLYSFVTNCSPNGQRCNKGSQKSVVEHKGMCHTEGLLSSPYRVFTITYMCHIFPKNKAMCHMRAFLRALYPVSTITYVWHISSMDIVGTLEKRSRNNQ
jgi:hypothetical protein